MPKQTAGNLSLYLPDVEADEAQTDFFPGLERNFIAIDEEITRVVENTEAGAAADLKDAKTDALGNEYSSLAARLNTMDLSFVPARFGAKGNGSTNDTSAFKSLEAASRGRVVDLEGKTYVVDTVFHGNYYVNGSFKYTYSYTNSSNQIVTNTATITSPYSLPRISDSNVFIGDKAGESQDFTREYMHYLGAYANTVIGGQAMMNNTKGWRNSVFGFQAMRMNKLGQNNAAFGDSALEYNIGETVTGGEDPGSRNAAFGSYALRYNETGRGNVGIGRNAAHSNVSGNYITAVGTNAYSGSVDEATGVKDVKTASNIVAVGYDALFHTNADDNIGIGVFAGYENLTGRFNVIIGNNAARSGKAIGRDVVIGTSAMRDATTALDNVAIGTEALRWLISGSSNTAIGDSALSLYVDGTNLTSANNCVGLGKKARVSGDNQIQLGFTSTIPYAYSALQLRSDERDKADIRPTVLGLDFIKQVEAIDFKYDFRDDYIEEYQELDEETGDMITKTRVLAKDGSKKRARFHHGVRAQQLEKVLHDMGQDFGGLQHHARNGGADVYSVGYEEFIGPLIRSVQELSEELEELRPLKDTVKELMARIEKLEGERA